MRHYLQLNTALRIPTNTGYRPEAWSEMSRLMQVLVGCREFESFEQAFRYETRLMDKKEWKAWNPCKDITCVVCERAYDAYVKNHGPTKHDKRVYEVAGLWLLQDQLEGKIEFTPYRPEWLGALVREILG